MIFAPVLQIYIFLAMLFGGFIAYFFYVLTNIWFLNSKNLIVQTILNVLNILVSFVIFFIFLNIFHFGKFRLMLFVGFILGFFWCKTTFKNTVAFLQIKLYNSFRNFVTEYKIFKSRKNGTIAD